MEGGLVHKNNMQQQGARISNTSPFGSIRFVLDPSARLVSRRYPTVVDTIAKCGGMSRVVTFFIFSVMALHHMIFLEQYLLNDVLLGSEKINDIAQKGKTKESEQNPEIKQQERNHF